MDLEAKFRVSVEGKEELASFFQRSEQAAHNFRSNIGSALQATGADMLRFSVSAGKALASVAGFNLSITGQARSVLEFRDAVARLGTVADLPISKLDELKTQILSVSVASGQMKEGVTEGLNAFVARTGDIETGRRNLELYAKAATATGATMSEVALIGAELSDKLKIKDQAVALGILAKQSDIGTVEFKDMARQAPRILTSAANAGLTGEKGLREFGGLAQVYAKGRGGPGASATVATEIDATFSEMIKKADKLHAMGIATSGRDPIDVLQEFIRKTGGDADKIVGTKLFGIQATRGVLQLAKDFREHGGKFADFEKFRDAGGAESVIDEKFQRNSNTGLYRLNALRARAEQLVDKGVDFASQHPLTTGALGIGGGLGLMFARNMLQGGGGGLRSYIPGMGGGVQRVEVTNWPGGSSFSGAGGTGGKLVSTLDKVGSAITAFTMAYGITKAIDEHFDISGQAAEQFGELTGQSADMRNTELAGVRSNKAKLRSIAAGRKRFSSAFESQGIGHGRAVYLAEHPKGVTAAEKTQVNNAIQIVINDDKATVTDGSGTRSNVQLQRRGAAQ